MFGLGMPELILDTTTLCLELEPEGSNQYRDTLLPPPLPSIYSVTSVPMSESGAVMIRES